MTIIEDILVDMLDMTLGLFRLFGKLIAKGFHLLGECPFAFVALVPLYAWGIITQTQMNWAMLAIMVVTLFAVIDHDAKVRAEEKEEDE